MTDILIRGLDIPSGYTVNLKIYSHGEVFAECPLYKHGKIFHGSAIELSEHDDLISKEGVINTIERLRDKCGNDEMEFALNWALRLVKEKPSVISASTEETE